MRAIFSQTNPNGTYLCLEDIGGAIAVCSAEGELLGATPSARALLARLGINPPSLPHKLPPSLWGEIAGTPLGEATEWRPAQPAGGACLGCTRYRLGDAHALLLMREVSEKQLVLSQRLHQQRLEATGRLVATIAHDLREPLASIVYNADVLATSNGRISPDLEREILAAIRAASDQLRGTVDGLLDFARLGPPVATEVCLPHVIDRVLGLLRPRFREGEHTVTHVVDPRTPWVRGNPLILEQILVNLVMNAVEAATGPTHIHIRVEPQALETDGCQVRITIEDDGPGVPPELRDRIFDPFYTSKPKGTGLGLTVAREAAEDLGGDLLLLASDRGARFQVRLPCEPGSSSSGEP